MAEGGDEFIGLPDRQWRIEAAQCLGWVLHRMERGIQGVRSVPVREQSSQSPTAPQLIRAFVLLFVLAVPAFGLARAQTLGSLDSEARAAYLAQDYERAASLAKQAYEKLQRDSDGREDFDLATAAMNVGNSLRKAGKHKEAIGYIKAACRIAAAVRGERSREAASCLMMVVEVTAAADDVPSAKKWASQTIAAVSASTPGNGLAAAHFHLGEVFRKAQAPAEASRHFAEAARMYRPNKLGNVPFLIASLTQQAESMHEAGEYAEAANALEEAISLERVQAPAGRATVISKVYLLANCYTRIGDFDRAIAALQTVAEALKGVTAQGHASVEDILLQVAERQDEAGGSSEALATLQEVIERAEKAGTEEAAAFKIEALERSGGIQAAQHDYLAAERSFEKQLQAAGKVTDRSARTQALRALGFFLLKRGRYAEARTRLDQALAELEQVSPGSPSVAAIQEQIAVALMNANDCEEASPLIEQAIDIYTAHAPDSRQLVRALKLAAVCEKADEAKFKRTEAALALQLKVDRGISASLLTDMASNFERRGNLKAARNAANMALELDPRSVGAHDVLASVLVSMGKAADGVRNLRTSTELAAQAYGEDSINVAARRFNLGRALLRNGEEPAARQEFLNAARSFGAHADRQLQALSIAEQRQLILGQTAVQTSALLSACRNHQCLGQAYELMAPWKGLLVEGLRREVAIARGAGRDDAVLARWRTLRSELAKWSTARGAVKEEVWKKRADELAREKELVERKLLGDDKAAAHRTPVTLRSLQASLRADEFLVDVYRFDQFGRTSKSETRYGAVITGHRMAPRHVDLGPAAIVDTAIQKWLFSLAGNSAAPWNSLRQQVWAQIRKTLPRDARHVRVSADGELVRIPWHAMESEDQGVSLQVAEVDSPRSLIHLRAQAMDTGAAKVLVVGGLNYDAGRTPDSPGAAGSPFGQLTWSESESNAVMRLATENGLLPVLLDNDRASKKAVLSDLGGSGYLHLATHGFANGEAERGLSGRAWSVGTRAHFVRDPLIDSGLAISGANVRDRNTMETEGVLSAADLLETDLSRSSMVVLSACNTGLGLGTPAQGVMGLRSALSAAGASRLLLSLWSVDDEATKVLMTEFYAALWSQKKSAVSALQQAQRKVRDEPRFSAPRFWAGWVVIDAK